MVTQIVDVSSVIAAASPRVTIKTLSSFSGWSAASANQVVALQWQLTGANACTVDLTILNVRFLP